MKYLRIFEKFEEFYTLVDHVPHGITYGSIPHQDQVRIINHFPSMCIINGSVIRYVVNDVCLYDRTDDLLSYTEISKVDIKIYDAPDEWFFVCLRFVPKYGESKPQRIFKCDQWEGLIKCLREEVINISSSS